MRGAIRNDANYLAAMRRRRTERFNDCFPRGITLGDVDSFCEINWHFLFIEWKPEGEDLNNGQHQALYRLSKQPNTTVYIVWTDFDGEIKTVQKLGHEVVPRRRGEEWLKQSFRAWAALADAAKPAND